MKPIGDFLPSVGDLRSAPPPVWLVNLVKWLFPMAALLFIALIAIPGVLQKWLWMRQLDYGGIFWTLLSIKVVLTCAGFMFAALFLWLNVRMRPEAVWLGSTLKLHREPALAGRSLKQD